MGFVIVVVIILGLLITGANLDDQQVQLRRWVRFFLYGSVVLLWISALGILMSALDPTFSDIVVSTPLAWAYLVLVMLGSVVAIGTLNSQRVREIIQQQVVGIYPTDKGDGWRGYDPNSTVHTTAVVLAIFAVLSTLGSFIEQGGLEGLAQDLSENAPGVAEILSTPVLYISVAFLGVGVLLRRDLPSALRRLGLRLPTISDWRSGFVYGFGLYVVQIVIAIAWMLVTDPDVFTQQNAAAQEIFAAYSSSIFFGLLVALSAGFGEEILFRGAIQPVFGILLTSLFFMLLHTQYTFTPAALIIFVVSAGFGRLRARESTTAAIIAHVLYNFIPFVLFALSPDVSQATGAILFMTH